MILPKIFWLNKDNLYLAIALNLLQNMILPKIFWLIVIGLNQQLLG